MKLRLLSLEETKRIYDRYLVRDFPPAERKPFASIRQLMEAGLYEPLGAEAGDGRLLAYAWQTVVPGCASALLDYFAVLPEGRGRGTGTAVLRALAARDAPHRDSLIIECEHPAEAPDPAAARRRIGFYLRAGARPTAMESRLFGVRYLIYAMPCGAAVPDADINADLQAIYRATVPEPYYRGNVIFYGA